MDIFFWKKMKKSMKEAMKEANEEMKKEEMKKEEMEKSFTEKAQTENTKIDDELDKPDVKYTNYLTIALTDNTILEWSIEVDGMHEKISPWKKFYKWYFVRESEDYMFFHKTGCSLIKRSLIKNFKILIKEENILK